MRDEPDIVKELRGVERLGALQSKVQSDYEELEVPEESPESISGKTVGFADDYVEGDKGTDTASGENIGVGSPKMENKYRLIAENTSDLICTTTFSLKPIYTYVSPSYKKILGYEPGEMIGKNSYDFVHPDDKKNITLILKKYLSMKVNKLLTGTEQNPVEKFENRVIDKSGNWHYVENTANIIGKEILIVSKDVTERKKAEEELNKYRIHLEELVDERTSKLQQEIIERKQVEEVLRESEEKYRSMIDDVLDASQTGISVLDSEFKVVWINHSIEKYFGFKKENIIGKDKRQLIESSIKDIFEDPDAFREEVFATYDNNTYIENFECHVLLDGKRRERWLEHRSQPIKLGLYKGGWVEYYTDITERKHIAEELAKIAAEQKNIMGTISDGIYMLDLKGNLVSWNRAAEIVTGLSAKELMGKPIVEFFAEKDRAAVAEVIRKGLKGGIGEVTGSFLRKGRSPAIYQWSVVPLKDPRGNVIGLTGVGRDITERKQVEDALRESEEKYRDLFENANDLIQSVAPDGHFVYVNRAWRNNLGYIEEEIVDLSLFDIIHPDSQAHCMEVFQRVMSGEKVDNVEAVFVAKGGKEISVAGNANCKFVDGKPVYTRGIFRDITERKQAEEALQESENKYRGLFESSRDAIMMLAPPNWLFTAGNPATIEMFRAKDGKEFISKGPWELSPKYQPDGQLSSEKARKMIEKAMKIGSNFFEWTHKRFDGEEFPTNVLLTRIELEGKESLQATVRDITERKQADEALQGVTEKLERKVDELQRFKKITVGRELKMRELKKRIEDLE